MPGWPLLFLKTFNFLKVFHITRLLKFVPCCCCSILLKYFTTFKSSKMLLNITACLHETQSELKPAWNLKTLWNVALFTWQFTLRFHCSNFPSNSKTLLHMCKWYLLVNGNLINAKQMLRYWLFFKQRQQDACALVRNFDNFAQLYITAVIYCFHGKLTVVSNWPKWNLHRSEFFFSCVGTKALPAAKMPWG